MHLPNSLNQTILDRAYRADGSLGNTSPKLVLPQATSRAFLSFQNTGPNVIRLEHGCARATATISGGVVTALTILNGGFGFTLAPSVQFKGGGGQIAAAAATEWDGRGQIDGWAAPQGVNTLVMPALFSRPAKAIAVLTAGAVSSFVITDGGAGYVNPPEVLLSNDPLDPFGCADPSASGGSGVYIAAGGTYYLNGTFCHTDAVALYASAGSATYYLEYAP